MIANWLRRYFIVVLETDEMVLIAEGWYVRRNSLSWNDDFMCLHDDKLTPKSRIGNVVYKSVKNRCLCLVFYYSKFIRCRYLHVVGLVVTVLDVRACSTLYVFLFLCFSFDTSFRLST